MSLYKSVSYFKFLCGVAASQSQRLLDPFTVGITRGDCRALGADPVPEGAVDKIRGDQKNRSAVGTRDGC